MKSVASEEHHFWVTALQDIATGESIVRDCFRAGGVGGGAPEWCKVYESITEARARYESANCNLLVSCELGVESEDKCKVVNLMWLLAAGAASAADAVVAADVVAAVVPTVVAADVADASAADAVVAAGGVVIAVGAAASAAVVA